MYPCPLLYFNLTIKISGTNRGSASCASLKVIVVTGHATFSCIHCAPGQQTLLLSEPLASHLCIFWWHLGKPNGGCYFTHVPDPAAIAHMLSHPSSGENTPDDELPAPFRFRGVLFPVTYGIQVNIFPTTKSTSYCHRRESIRSHTWRLFLNVLRRTCRRETKTGVYVQFSPLQTYEKYYSDQGYETATMYSGKSGNIR